MHTSGMPIWSGACGTVCPAAAPGDRSPPAFGRGFCRTAKAFRPFSPSSKRTYVNKEAVISGGGRIEGREGEKERGREGGMGTKRVPRNKERATCFNLKVSRVRRHRVGLRDQPALFV